MQARRHPRHPLRVSGPAADAGDRCSDSINHPVGLALPRAQSAWQGFSPVRLKHRQAAHQDRRVLISRPKRRDPQPYPRVRSAKKPHQCCKFLPAAPSPSAWSLPGSTYQRKARNYCRSNNTGSPEAFFLFEVWLTFGCDNTCFCLGATRDNAGAIIV